jgi:hypothetical protein
MYPDVFGPRFGLDQLPGAVDWVLRTDRERDLAGAGIPATVPIRSCENGWPTGPDRPEQVQADVLETILRTVHGLRAELNVTHWELFTLRDADSSKDGLFYNFGILRDDYSRKPAFARLRALDRGRIRHRRSRRSGGGCRLGGWAMNGPRRTCGCGPRGTCGCCCGRRSGPRTSAGPSFGRSPGPAAS